MISNCRLHEASLFRTTFGVRNRIFNIVKDFSVFGKIFSIVKIVDMYAFIGYHYI